MTLDLNDPETSLRNFARVRASADGTDEVVWFGGEVYAWQPGAPASHVFGFEGFNIARMVEIDGGFDLLSKEAVFYLDPDTREVLRTWDNPWTEQEVPVVHVWNDPVNFPFRYDGPRGPWELPWTDLGDTIVFTSDIFLAYPSPLPRAEFPDHSQADLYEAAELFQYFVRRDDLDGDDPSIPTQVSWTRMAPWVPFMAMGDRPGQLVYHCQGRKLPGGFEALPAWIKQEVERDQPGYAHAPTSMDGPNSSSWTYFKKLVEQDRIEVGAPA